jgi:hypothetical protein
MADSSILVAIETKDPLNGFKTGAKQPSLRALANHLEGLASGTKRGTAVDVWSGGADVAYSFGTIVLDNASVDDTVSINGVAITAKASADIGALQFSQGGTDAADATSLCAVINGTTNALIQHHVEASNFSGSVALDNAEAGNWVEIALSDGRRWTFTGGTDWSVAGNDTQDGDSLTAAINGTNGLNREVVAINTAGTVHVYQRRGTSATVVLTKSGDPLTVGAVAASARTCVSALQPGIAGNCVTLASSNGSRIAVSGARLTGGTGANVAKVSFKL